MWRRQAAGPFQQAPPGGRSQRPSWQVELYDFSYDPAAAEPWPPEIVNQIPVDGLQNGAPAVQATWHALHVALTAAMAATGRDFGLTYRPWTSPRNWNDSPGFMPRVC